MQVQQDSVAENTNNADPSTNAQQSAVDQNPTMQTSQTQSFFNQGPQTGTPQQQFQPNQPSQNQMFQNPAFFNPKYSNQPNQGFSPKANYILQQLFSPLASPIFNPLFQTPAFPGTFGGYRPLQPPTADAQQNPRVMGKHTATLLNDNKDPALQGQPIAGLHPPAPRSHEDTAFAHMNWFESQFKNMQDLFGNWLKKA